MCRSSPEKQLPLGPEAELLLLCARRSLDPAGKARVVEIARSLELLDLTLADPRHRRRLRELARLREALADYFVFENRFGSTDKSWRSYFHAFTYAAALRRGR